MITAEIIAARTRHMTPVELRVAWTRLGVQPRDIEGPPNGVLVGEMPPASMGTCLPLFPHPVGSAGGRLLRLSGMPAEVYLGRFFRRNLFDEHCKWSLPVARERAAKLREEWKALGNTRALLFGQRVGEAFGFEGFFVRHTEHYPDAEGGFSHEIVCLPHPSGLNQMYNDPKVCAATRAAMMWAAGLT